jgi:hypothetical protein
MQPVLVNFVMDKSGSMHHLVRSSIDGFNQFLWDQQRQGGECRLSLTMFDTSFDVRHVAKDINTISPLTPMDYQPGGGTALLDAVGTTVKGAEQWLLNNNWNPQPIMTMGREQKAYFPARLDWKVIVVILTDGEENSSREWHLNQPMVKGDDRDLGGLIQWKQNEGWEFMFLGTGGSGWLERTFGAYVPHDHFVGYAATNDAHTHTYAGLSASVSSTRSTGTFDTSHLHEPEQNTGSTPK